MVIKTRLFYISVADDEVVDYVKVRVTHYIGCAFIFVPMGTFVIENNFVRKGVNMSKMITFTIRIQSFYIRWNFHFIGMNPIEK